MPTPPLPVRSLRTWSCANVKRTKHFSASGLFKSSNRLSAMVPLTERIAAVMQVLSIKRPSELARRAKVSSAAVSQWQDGTTKSLGYEAADYAKGRQVPLISWVRASAFDEASDPYPVGEAEEWVPAPRNVSEHAYALRVRGDSMYNPMGPKSYPDGSIVIIDPAQRSPVSGQVIVAKIDGAPDVTLKRYRNEDGRQWLQPLNPTFPSIDEPFKVLGTAVGKWEPEN